MLDVWNRERIPGGGEAEPEERARDVRAPVGRVGSRAPDLDDESELDLPEPGHYVTYPGEGR